MKKINNQTVDNFLNFLESTLIPDLKESGSIYTAEDFESCVEWIKYFRGVSSVKYKPLYLSWCKSYKEEVKEMRELIESSPSDEKQLKKEYKLLTGKQFRRSK